jgi:hypothetical protein
VPPRRPLTPQTAQITTASVEIKTLTVSGKQVTMAVFRQLYQEPLYDHLTWESQGTPWCRVNYHPDKCGDSPRTHEHIVWQKGNELRRARVNQPNNDLDEAPGFGFDDDAALCLAAGGVPEAEVLPSSIWYQETRYTLGHRWLPFSLLHLDREMDGKLHIQDHDLAVLLDQRGYNRQKETIRERHAEIHPEGTGCAETLPALEARANQYAEWKNAAQQCWKEVLDLDQVFIAV